MTEDQINRRWVEILIDTLSEEKPVTIGPRDASCFINALRALLAPTQQPSGEVTHGNTTMGECMASLLDRLEVAELYADRYRYLRERPLDAVSNGGVFAGKTPDNVVLNGADLDAAIDAARAGGQ
ncbi:hypothetical protein [Burkholderia cepacia]|uniref:hypothetical protein n=1 Tax=Burkholderia cepacia TaxID=292 RepID=UPI000751F6FD|nr:hypothetical protein [Burkholderia cepacia]KWH52534.1 hypothetical protein WM00_19395 [Burkholderia cepacia]